MTAAGADSILQVGEYEKQKITANKHNFTTAPAGAKRLSSGLCQNTETKEVYQVTHPRPHRFRGNTPHPPPPLARGRPATPASPPSGSWT